VIAQAQLDLKAVPRDDLKWVDLRRDTEVAIIELARALSTASSSLPSSSATAASYQVSHTSSLRPHTLAASGLIR
jgi:hypothetical protein